MDVFQVRDKVIGDGRSFTTASIDIKDARLNNFAQTDLDQDRQWLEPWPSVREPLPLDAMHAAMDSGQPYLTAFEWEQS